MHTSIHIHAYIHTGIQTYRQPYLPTNIPMTFRDGQIQRHAGANIQANIHTYI